MEVRVPQKSGFKRARRIAELNGVTINLDKWAACIHEAGHIVAVQAAPNQTFESASVWQEGADWRGKTVYADPDYTPAAAPEITTIAVGGKVAETHCFGDFNDAAWDRDFEHLEAEWEKCGKSAGLSVGETFAQPLSTTKENS